MKLAVIIITYYPSQEVITNILSYSRHFEKIYIFDNTPVVTELQQLATRIPNALFLHDGENRGLPERLNSGCRMAMADGFQWVLTMDQDTRFDPETINNYLSCFKSYVDKSDVAAFGVRYSRLYEVPNAVCKPAQVSEAITSGMLLNLNIWHTIRGFDEALFIDAVDHEYCIRAGMHGYKIIQASNICIQHEIGTEVYRGSIKSLYLIRKRKEIHSPLRCYYMYRNMLYLTEKYKHTNSSFVDVLQKNVLTHIKICQNYGRERSALKQYIQIAKEDFKNNKMGKIEDFRLLN